MGTEASTGVKLLSVAGDRERPGIYEVPGHHGARGVGAGRCARHDGGAGGGPSGTCVSAQQFDRRLSYYEDLSTGGAFTIFSHDRDLLSIVHNHMTLFANETCGFCVPRRAGTTLMLKSLEKIMVGNGTVHDLKAIEHLGGIVRTASRCGLGQTAPNPLLSTLSNFAGHYRSLVRADVDEVSQFNLEFASAESNIVAGRRPNLQRT
ncbi:MAG: NADH-ubiquinone oxidoreductase-F iron-sulfur binding region domain-containing protein [Vicinamibacterales bacterium]